MALVSFVFPHKDQEADVCRHRLAATLPLSPIHRLQLARPVQVSGGRPPYSGLPNDRGQGLPECGIASIPYLLDHGPSDCLRLLQAAPTYSEKPGHGQKREIQNEVTVGASGQGMLRQEE